nr:uncharacterized protein LOC111515028 [Leptinotarsa decemlineata]
MTSPPYHPASNGAAENSVKTIKQFIIKTLKSSYNIFDEISKQSQITELDLYNFLVLYRNTEHCSTGESPARLMLGRALRTRLDLIKPINIPVRKPKPMSTIKDNIIKSQNRQKRNYRGKIRDRLEIGQKVLVKDYRRVKPEWTSGIVIRRLGKNIVKVRIPNTNLEWKRHINQILPVHDSYVNLGEVEISKEQIVLPQEVEKSSSQLGSSEAPGAVVGKSQERDSTMSISNYDNINSTSSDQETGLSQISPSELSLRPQRFRKPPERFVP